MNNVDPIAVIEGIADECGDLQKALTLREAAMSLKRLAAIKAHHHRYEKVTDGGTLVHPSIHGFRLHELLYGDLDSVKL